MPRPFVMAVDYREKYERLLRETLAEIESTVKTAQCASEEHSKGRKLFPPFSNKNCVRTLLSGTSPIKALPYSSFSCFAQL